ncbi:gamma-glutamyltransferase family protein [Roseinatronobacter sp. S2]|uniref:gamma-glutamyltransferase family protein n=1 Tax=Roseinatronobacter sp. S2 TaxID=3035471 RepID=UPI00240F713E|nr:gamma-glutamyltransferase [Roseinatronobacter sp. S2]WFE75700.1 gamma-glutamyltransferase [Roseinatronobacter sp. S2]
MTAALTTPHPLATAAGMNVLRAGGTAPEALIAAGAVLAVVMPHFCGLGGDAVWLVTTPKGGPRSFMAIGQGLDRPFPTGPIPLRGAGSIMTSAAVVAGWAHALDFARAELDGRSRWGDLLAPAIRHAEAGFPVTASQEFWTRFRAADLPAWPGFAPVFLQDGQPPKAGHILHQRELAHSLRSIAQDGAQAFYRGALSHKIVDGLRAAGVHISHADLARTTCREGQPLSLPYRGLTLLAPPPPTQGLTTLQIMGQLAALDFSNVQAGSADHIHLCVEAVKRAFLQRGQIADPAFHPMDMQHQLDQSRLDGWAQDISMSTALPWPHVWAHGDTVFLGAIDEMGNAASVLQSTYFDWGSGVVAGDTGIIWQNRGAAFSADPAHVNAFAPGKLPFYTLNPGIALQGGKPKFVYGTQGADGQPQTLAMVLTRMIDFGQSPPDALAGPRFLLGRTFSDSRDSLKLEADVDAPTRAALAARGHEISMIAAQSPMAGLAGVVQCRDGRRQAWHDPRL